MTENKIFFPYKRYEGKDPLVFLAGPIIGARNWQKNAIDFIQQRNSNIVIASPRQPDGLKSDFSFEEQVDWESYHLTKASEQGAIIFWLAKEQEHFCNRPFAQTSRFELGEWKTKQEDKELFLFVGIEDGFTNSRYITRRLNQDCPQVNICHSLEETCSLAMTEIILRQKKG